MSDDAGEKKIIIDEDWKSQVEAEKEASQADEAGEKKIIVDEDWKSQVAAEKEAIEQGDQPGDATKAADAAEMPQASFSMLVSMLATEAMIGLGQLPHPVTGEATASPEHATYFIDSLGMLEEKPRQPVARRSTHDGR
ncbi:unnamed protein product, partial [marine sediment metagenome]